MNDYLARSPTPNRVTLDRRKYAFMAQLGPSVQNSLALERTEDILTGNLVYRLTADLLTEKLVGDTCEATLTLPATWLDFVKRDKWYLNLDRDRIMRWVARRWPIRYKTYTVKVRFDRYAKFPNSTLNLPELGAPVVFEQWGEPVWDA